MSLLKKLSGKKDDTPKIEDKSKSPGAPIGIWWTSSSEANGYVIKWAGSSKKSTFIEQEPIYLKSDQTSLLLSGSDIYHVIKAKGFNKLRFAIAVIDEHGNESEYSEYKEIMLDNLLPPKLEILYGDYQ